MTPDLGLLAADLGPNATTVVGVGVFSMLVALFTLFIKAMGESGKRVDSRSDAELARKDAELVKKDVEIAMWRDLYLEALKEHER